MATRDRGPDVYIIVADCLRADSLPPPDWSAASPGDSGFVSFPRTISSSSWTLPAHVSILSGLSPEQHDIHRLGASRIPPDLPWLPSALSARGYRTFLVSANHTLNPGQGFGRGFDLLAWGRWGENAFRLSSSQDPPFLSERTDNHDPLKEHVLLGPGRGLSRLAARCVANLPRFPWLLDATARVARKMLLPQDANFEVTPWIEPTFDRMLGRFGSEEAVFALVNLMDCHEPYLPSVGGRTSWADWLRLGRIRQDRTNWTYEPWPYSEEELAALRGLYAHQVATVGRRIGRLLKILEARGRLERSLVLITGDHGQALGEHQRLFHNGGLSEPEIRVPLWIRFPDGRVPTPGFSDWTSLIDVYPTVAAEAGLPIDPRQSGVPLGRPGGMQRPAPAIAVADGMFTPEQYLVSGPGCRWNASVAAYNGRLKVVVQSARPQISAFDIERDPGELRDLWSPTNAEAGRLAGRALGVLRRLEARGAAPPGSTEVEARLSSWGYLA
ncbi:MAG: sulfatase-like hydrolase/transferase [Thermoplasmata archaeon]|nr:sulfatase-like hydrolase/transferase [Thermoplasmata archaeon]